MSGRRDAETMVVAEAAASVTEAASIVDPAAASARIDATIAALPVGMRGALQALRETIAAAAPEAVETISYDMPAFRYRGRALVAYAGFKAHCSLFPMSGAVMDTHRAALSEFSSGRGTLRFTPDHPIPDGLVTALVRDRMSEIDRARTRR